MLLDKVYKMAQIGGLDASADIDLLKKDTGAHGRHPDAHDRDDRSAQEGQPHRKRTREGDRLPRHGGGLLRGDPPPHRQARKRSSTTRRGRCPNIGNFCSSNRFRNFQSGCEDAAEAFPRRFFATDAPGTAATQRTAADAGLRFRTPPFPDPPRPAARGRPLVFPHPPHPSKCPPCRRSRRRPMQHARAKKPTGSFRADRSDYSGFFPTFVRIFPASAGGAAENRAPHRKRNPVNSRPKR